MEGKTVVLVWTIGMCLAILPLPAVAQDDADTRFRHTIQVLWDNGTTPCAVDPEDTPLEGVSVEIYTTVTDAVAYVESQRISLTLGAKISQGWEVKLFGGKFSAEIYAEVEAEFSTERSASTTYEWVTAHRTLERPTDSNGCFTLESARDLLNFQYSIVIPPGFSEISNTDAICTNAGTRYPEGGRATGTIDGLARSADLSGAATTHVLLRRNESSGTMPVVVGFHYANHDPDQGLGAFFPCSLSLHTTRERLDGSIEELDVLDFAAGESLAVDGYHVVNPDTNSIYFPLDDRFRFSVVADGSCNVLGPENVSLRGAARDDGTVELRAWFEIYSTSTLPQIVSKVPFPFLTSCITDLDQVKDFLVRIGALRDRDALGDDVLQSKIGIGGVQIRFDRPFAFRPHEMLEFAPKPGSTRVLGAFPDSSDAEDGEQFTVWIVTLGAAEIGVRGRDQWFGSEDEVLWIPAPTTDMLFANDSTGGRTASGNEYSFTAQPLKPDRSVRDQTMYLECDHDPSSTSPLPDIDCREVKAAYPGDLIRVELESPDPVMPGSDRVPCPRAWLNGREQELQEDNGIWWAEFAITAFDRTGEAQVSTQFVNELTGQLVYIAELTSHPVEIGMPSLVGASDLGTVNIGGPPDASQIVTSGDQVILTFTAKEGETFAEPPAVIMGWANTPCEVTEDDGSYQAVYAITFSDPQDMVPFTIDFIYEHGEPGGYCRCSETSDGSSVHVDFAELEYVNLREFSEQPDGVVELWDLVALTFYAETGSAILGQPDVTIVGTEEAASDAGSRPTWQALHMMVYEDLGAVGPVEYSIEFTYDSGLRGYVFEVSGIDFVVPEDVTAPLNPSVTWTGAYDMPTNANEAELSIGMASDGTGWGVQGFDARWGSEPNPPEEAASNQADDWDGRDHHYPMDVDGAYYFHIATVDYAGNWSGWDTYGPFTRDTTAPSITEISTKVDGKLVPRLNLWLNAQAEVLTVSFKASEQLAAAEVQLSEGPVHAAIAPLGGIPWTAEIPFDGSYETGPNQQVSITATDLAGNETTVAWDVGIDVIAPTAPSLISPSDGYVTAGQWLSFAWTAAQDQGGSGFLEYRLLIERDGALWPRGIVQLGPSAQAYEANLGGNQGQYEWYVRAVDAAANVADSERWAFEYDCQGPSVMLEQAPWQVDPTSSPTIDFVARFEEPVTGFDGIGDVTLEGTAGASVVDIQEIDPMDGTTYRVSVSGIPSTTTSGTVRVLVPAGVGVDAAGNGNAASCSSIGGNEVTYDIGTPTFDLVTATSSNPRAGHARVGHKVTLEFALSDMIDVDRDNVVQIARSDLGVPRQVSFAQRGDSYLAEYEMTEDDLEGEVWISLTVYNTVGKMAHTTATTDGTAITFDKSCPTVLLSRAVPWTHLLPVEFVATFSEPVVGFDHKDLELSGTGGAAFVSVSESLPPGDATTYNVNVSSLAQNGNVRIAVPAGTAFDLAGNPCQAGASASVVYDTLPPNPPALTASSHLEGSWSANDSVVIAAGGAIDPGTPGISASGVEGFEAVWNTSSQAPTWSGQLTHLEDWEGGTYEAGASGEWYLHVLTQDRAGNRSYSRSGPYCIDLDPPVAPTVTSSHAEGAWSNDDTIDIDWSGAGDAHSGVSTYEISWDHSPTGGADPADSEVSHTGGSLTFTTDPLGEAEEWYLHLVTVDAVGNSSTSHLGPFAIDTTAPAVTAIAAAHDGLSGWTNNNSFTVNFSAGDDGSGVLQYAYAINSSETLDPAPTDWQAYVAPEPDETVRLDEDASTSGELYFHLVVADVAGNRTTRRFGAYAIDLVAPQAPDEISFPDGHQEGSWSNDATIRISWRGASDHDSGVAGYEIGWNHSDVARPDVMHEVAHATDPHEFETSTLDDADNWYLHLRTRDVAGNATWLDAMGPFRIDTKAPPAPEASPHRPHIVYEGYDVVAPGWEDWCRKTGAIYYCDHPCNGSADEYCIEYSYFFDWHDVDDPTGSGLHHYKVWWWFETSCGLKFVEEREVTTGWMRGTCRPCWSQHPWVGFQVKAVDNAGNESPWGGWWALEGGSECEGCGDCTCGTIRTTQGSSYP